MLKLLKVISGIFVVLIIALAIFIATLDANNYKSNIIELVEQSTGRQLTLNGDVVFSPSLVPIVVVENAQLSNASWGSEPTMVSLDKFEIELALIPLFKNQVEVKRFILNKPTIVLETNDKGLGNWIFETKADQEIKDDDAAAPIPAIVFNEFDINDATIIYKDGISKQKSTIEVTQFTSAAKSIEDTISLFIKAAYNSMPIELDAKLGSLQQLLGNQHYPIDLSLNIDDAKALIKGAVGKPLEGKKLDLDINLFAHSLQQFASLSQDPLPDVQAINISGSLSNTSSLDINAIYNTAPVSVRATLGSVDQLVENKSFPVDLAIVANEAESTIKGHIAQPLDGKGLDLAISFAADAIQQLSVFTKTELPEITDITLTSTINDAISVDLNAVYNTAMVELTGTVGSLEQLLANELFPVDLALIANEAKADIKGAVAQPLDGKGLDLSINFEADALQQLAVFTNAELPQVNAINLSGTISDAVTLDLKANYNATPIQIRGNTGSINQLLANELFPVDLTVIANQAKAIIKGEIAKPMDAKGLDLAIDFDAESLSQLSALAQTELPKLAPVKLSTQLQEKDDIYSLNAMMLNFGQSDVSGSLIANLMGDKPSITAELNSNIINLTDFSSTEQQAESDEKEASSNTDARLFSTEPLMLAALNAVDVDIAVNAKKIKTASLSLTDTQLKLTLNAGNLLLHPMTTLVAGSKVDAMIKLDSTDTNATLETDIKVNGFEPSQLENLKQMLSGATTDVTLKVKGTGASVSDIMAGLNGKLVIKANSGSINSSAGNLLGTDLLSAINPFAKSSEQTKLQCAAVNFIIKDGIATADDGIAISMEKMNIIGDGTIDLKTEKINISIDPQSREGVGLNAGKIANLVKIGGTLAKPQPTADGAATLGTGLSVGTAVATGGVSLLVEGLLDRATAESDPCAVALGLAPKPVKPTPAELNPVVPKITTEQTPENSAR